MNQTKQILDTAEYKRLHGKYEGKLVRPWRKWGPYTSDRAWGTVREDYSAYGTAWDFLTHDMARSKAYRWGEDGIAGLCDRYQILVFSVAVWNRRDPILKERLFGVNSGEGNHGEDVKEYYYYLDSTPSHSYMKMLYKYPQHEYPYGRLVHENRSRGGRGQEFELIDTGIFDDDRYFDVYVEYAKASEEDICIRIEAINRGPDDAELHVLPHLWFRNSWAWTETPGPEPHMKLGTSGRGYISIDADDRNALPPQNLIDTYQLGLRHLYADGGGTPLFTNNETNAARVFGPGNESRSQYVKDAFHRYIINGEHGAVNPANEGTKACIDYKLNVPAGQSAILRLRLTPERLDDPLRNVDDIFAKRKYDADQYYNAVQPASANEEEKMIQRQAFAGLLWSKEMFYYDVNLWLEGDNPKCPPPESRWHGRNLHWRHLNSMRVLSMPDKWEYPWFAAWDLAFQCTTIALVDPGFAADNLWFLLFEQFQHINGQIPAYEWEFSDLNPPVHAWAVWRVYEIERDRFGYANRDFLEKCFHKLLINFAWWVNKVDSQGNNVFEGGFLGLDNITVVDRSEKLPNGAILEQSDGTGWMAFFCIYMMHIALELAKENSTYEGLATKFFQHYTFIGKAMKNVGGRDFQLWDEKDGFFYDTLRYPNGEFHRFRVRSQVGLIPIFAVEVLHEDELKQHAAFKGNLDWFLKNRQALAKHACFQEKRDGKEILTLSIVDQHQLKRLLERLCDPNEFLSDYGIRSLSKYHREHPFQFGNSVVRYEPAEEDIKLKGGNSNWRGPIWFPTAYLIVEALTKYAQGFGPKFGLEGPDGQITNTSQMAEDIANRMINIFRRDSHGHRPVFGGARKFQEDPHWRDHLLFYEHFHGDNGAGIGASHQTGWTALVANLIDELRS
jgi:mannosylglycerate hydrolase MGH1-like protein/glycosyl hydrolase family 63